MRAPALDPEALFQQEFVRGLFERAVESVRQEMTAAGKTLPLTLFERFDLSPREGDTYAKVAAELGLTTSQVTNGLALARRRFREKAIGALRLLCGTDEEFRRDAREIFGVDVE
jgi:hypothetical protein